MIRAIATGIFVLLFISGKTQTSANSWIDYSNDRYYLAIKVSTDELFRIPQSSLNVALSGIGVDLSDIDPRSLQLFGRGQEQYIHVQGEEDGSLDPTDYIEFYGQRNDGWADEVLYPSSDEHTNPYYSLFNDTATYYLTWDPSGAFSGFRYTTVANGSPAPLPLSYVWYDQVVSYKNVYQKGKDLGSGVPVGNFIGGKGWMTGNIGYNGSSISNLTPHAYPTPNLYTGSGAPDGSLQLAVSGVNMGAGGLQAHHLQVNVNNGSGYATLDNLLYSSYAYVRTTIPVPNNRFGATTTVQLKVDAAVSPLSTTSDYSACAYMRLRYPRNLNLNNASVFIFHVPENVDAQYFNASNFSTAVTTHLYDLGQHKRYAVIHNTTNGSVKCNIDPGAVRMCVLATDNAISIVSAGALKAVNGSGQFTNPSTWEVEQAYVIITHQSLLAEAQGYAQYRSSEFNTVVIDIETLYDQFAYGIRKNPLAIRNFMAFAFEEWATEPQYLFLMGKSIEERYTRKSAALMKQSLVPSMGYPVSDASLTAGLNEKKCTWRHFQQEG
jgi:hypothetical protein